MANRSLKALLLLLVFGIVGACSNAPVARSTSGIYNNQKYIITLTAMPRGFDQDDKLEINGTEILLIESAIYPNRDTNCSERNGLNYICKYSSSYKGLPVLVEKSTLSGYEVYLNNEFLANVKLW